MGDVRTRCIITEATPFLILCLVCLQSEARVVSAFVELVVKLNEATFKPLFRRLHDWAFVNEGGSKLPCF